MLHKKCYFSISGGVQESSCRNSSFSQTSWLFFLLTVVGVGSKDFSKQFDWEMFWRATVLLFVSLSLLAGLPPNLNKNIKVFWTEPDGRVISPSGVITIIHLIFVIDSAVFCARGTDCGCHLHRYCCKPVLKWIKASWILDQTLTHSVSLSTTPSVSNVVFGLSEHDFGVDIESFFEIVQSQRSRHSWQT